jgi:hypothetical protein
MYLFAKGIQPRKSAEPAWSASRGAVLVALGAVGAALIDQLVHQANDGHAQRHALAPMRTRNRLPLTK